MPFKHSQTSTHPAFVPFGVWIEEKVAEAQAANNTAEVDKIRAALQAKQASVADIVLISGDESTSTVDKEMPIVAEFDHYYDQWVAEFNVTTSVEEVA